METFIVIPTGKMIVKRRAAIRQERSGPLKKARQSG